MEEIPSSTLTNQDIEPKETVKIVYIYTTYYDKETSAKQCSKWRAENPEKWKNYDRTRKNNLYKTDPEYRKTLLEYQKQLYKKKVEKKKLLLEQQKLQI